jgi:hypothetical protein
MARLMTGDVPGADVLHKTYLDARVAKKDPLVEFELSQWDWLCGRRKQAQIRMANFARSAENSPLRQAASEAYSNLTLWNLAIGDRATAAESAQKAVALAGSASAPLAVVARFIAQPSASAAEWTERAQRSFPNPAQNSLKQSALLYALLFDKEFQPAAQLLKSLYATTSPTVDNSMGIVLAWTYLETGKPKEAAALLRFNPLPPTTGISPLNVLFFPRLFYLRGRVAALAGSADQARVQYRIFQQLSGDQPLIWGEEAQAK